MHAKWNFENSYLNLPDIFYSKTKAESFPKLELLFKNEDLINTLNINYKNFNNLLFLCILNIMLNYYQRLFEWGYF